MKYETSPQVRTVGVGVPGQHHIVKRSLYDEMLRKFSPRVPSWAAHAQVSRIEVLANECLGPREFAEFEAKFIALCEAAAARQIIEEGL